MRLLRRLEKNHDGIRLPQLGSITSDISGNEVPLLDIADFLEKGRKC